MRRIAVMGSPGAGKTRFAVRLGEMTGLPVVHLDRLFWRPGWEPSPLADYRARHDAAIAEERWIVDGVYSRHFGKRLKRADAIVLFVVPTPLTLFRIAKRVAAMRGRTRPDMGEGCPERWDWAFMHWVLTWRTRRLPAIREAIRSQGAGAVCIEVHSRRGAEAALKRLADAAARAGASA
jgi:adenylate kinase family enzyme